MEKMRITTNTVLKTLANAMVDKDTREWPPGCGFFMYQPPRPQRKINNDVPMESKDEKIEK